MNLIQIEKGWHLRKMKEGEGTFQAKKSPGGGIYWIRFSDGHTAWHTSNIIETLTEEVKDGKAQESLGHQADETERAGSPEADVHPNSGT